MSVARLAPGLLAISATRDIVDDKQLVATGNRSYMHLPKKIGAVYICSKNDVPKMSKVVAVRLCRRQNIRMLKTVSFMFKMICCRRFIAFSLVNSL